MNEITKVRIEARMERVLEKKEAYESLYRQALDDNDTDRASRIDVRVAEKRGEYYGMLDVLNVLGYGVDEIVSAKDGTIQRKVVAKPMTVLM